MNTINELVVPRVATRPGLIASAKTFRLVFDGENLSVIHLGRAMGPKVRSGDYLADLMAGKIVNKMELNLERKLAETEREIARLPLSSLVARKNSFQVSVAEKGAVTCKVRPGLQPELIVKSSEGKGKFFGSPDAGEDFERIAAAFA